MGELDFVENYKRVRARLYPPAAPQRSAIVTVLPDLPVLNKDDKQILRIQKIVARKYGITVEAMIGPGKARHLVRPRYEAIYRAREELCMSISQLGRAFNKDGRTICYYLAKQRAYLLGATEREAIDFAKRSRGVGR